VLPIIVPPTLTFDILARCDNGRSTHHGNQIALTTNLDTQDTESALLTVESDSLDRPLQPFDRCIPVNCVLGARYHLPLSGSVFCEVMVVQKTTEIVDVVRSLQLATGNAEKLTSEITGMPMTGSTTVVPQPVQVYI